MKRIILSTVLSLLSLSTLFSQVNAEDFLQVVSLESEQGVQAVFTSAGMGASREEAELNAVKSLFNMVLLISSTTKMVILLNKS